MISIGEPILLCGTAVWENCWILLFVFLFNSCFYNWLKTRYDLNKGLSKMWVQKGKKRRHTSKSCKYCSYLKSGAGYECKTGDELMAQRCIINNNKPSWFPWLSIEKREMQLALSAAFPEWKRTFIKMSALAHVVTLIFQLLWFQPGCVKEKAGKASACRIPREG